MSQDDRGRPGRRPARFVYRRQGPCPGKSQPISDLSVDDWPKSTTGFLHRPRLSVISDSGEFRPSAPAPRLVRQAANGGRSGRLGPVGPGSRTIPRLPLGTCCAFSGRELEALVHRPRRCRAVNDPVTYSSAYCAPSAWPPSHRPGKTTPEAAMGGGDGRTRRRPGALALR